MNKVEHAKAFFLERISEIRNHVSQGDLAPFILTLQACVALTYLVEDPNIAVKYFPEEYETEEGHRLIDLCKSFSINGPGDYPKLNICHNDAEHLTRDSEGGNLSISANGFIDDVYHTTSEVFDEILANEDLTAYALEQLELYPLIKG